MKIFLEPHLNNPDKADGGIRRVIDAQNKYLPEFGIEITDKAEQADLTAGHVDHGTIISGKPFVSHNHGLMWSDYDFGDWGAEVNRAVVSKMLQAEVITVPSHWVAHALSYGMLREPKVIYHGVDTDEWQPFSEHQKYILWNKARHDSVSNVNELLQLAKIAPDLNFVSTVGLPKSNVKICGVMNYTSMRKVVCEANVYLAMARETFGIGTLEALAAGVPVAGWDYGGQSEIILQGETGYLASYGDYAALAECIRKCIDERQRLSVNARADAARRWQWQDKIEQYANLYKSTLADWNAPRPKVSVIVTCHNLAKYLPDALESLTQQTLGDWECIVVDDCSTDNTPQVAQQYVARDKRFKYARTPSNLKLSCALNFGHSVARGKYAMNLDADNTLPVYSLAILSDALDKRRELQIVYGGLDTMNEDGTGRKPNAFPYPVFSWFEQMAHRNQLHSSAMMRREVMELSGGYRERQWRAEDAEFWCRVSSRGFKIERVTSAPTLIYRWRGDSKSMRERRENTDIDGDWCEYFPWRTAASCKDGDIVIAQNPKAITNKHLVPFGAQGQRTDKPFWEVYHRQTPLVSVIIPCSKEHLRYLPDALDSLNGQLTNEWEAIVVNDSGEPLNKIPGFPFVRIVNTKGNTGAGAARNAGIKIARAPLTFFLDADDMLAPDCLLKMTARYQAGDCGYVYCGVKLPDSKTTFKTIIPPDYDRAELFRQGIHSMAMLIPTVDALKYSFDESMSACEDWDFWSKLAVNGICGALVPEPLYIYRKHIGQRSAKGQEHKKELYGVLRERYGEYARGAKTMAGCCGGNKDILAVLNKSRTMTMRVESIEQPVREGYTRMRYIGRYQAPVTYHANGREYKAANTAKWNLLDVMNEDVHALKLTGVFRELPIRKQLPQVVPVQKVEVISQQIPVETSAVLGAATASKAITQVAEIQSIAETITVPRAEKQEHLKRGRPKNVNRKSQVAA